MFDFDEIKKLENEDDDLLEEGATPKKKEGEDAEDWSIEEDLEDEEDMQ
ncbi:MAG TPA: hypothetical protein VJH05_01715 [Candidatus Paceibacterota bacterium]